MKGQIGGNLRPSEFAEFQRYVADLLITESSLANLLFQREVHLKRLGDLANRFEGAVTTKDRGGRVTGHQSNVELKEAFERHVEEQGLTVGHAVAILCRAELEERSIAQFAGDTRWNQIDSGEGTG